MMWISQNARASPRLIWLPAIVKTEVAQKMTTQTNAILPEIIVFLIGCIFIDRHHSCFQFSFIPVKDSVFETIHTFCGALL